VGRKLAAGRLALALLVAGGAAWTPSRIGLMLLLPGCCRLAGREGPLPLWAGPALSLLAWGAALPLAGLAGLGPVVAGRLILAVLALFILLGKLRLAALPGGKEGWVPAGIAVLLLGLRLLPLGLAVGPPGAELAFHGLVARRVLECQAWPADLAPQAPGVAAAGFAPALAFLGAAGAGDAACLPRSLLGLVCLSQWCVDAGALALGVALAGGTAGSLAATGFALAAPFPPDVAGGGGAGNLLALSAGLLLLAGLARGGRPGAAGWAGWGLAAGAAHGMAAGLLALGLCPLAARRRTLRPWLGLLLGAGLAAGGPMLLGPRFSREEQAAAAAWGRATGPAAPETLPAAAIAPGRIAVERLGAGVAGLALLGLVLAAARPRLRPPGALGPACLGGAAWLLLTGLPARAWPALGLFYPERVLLMVLPIVLYGLAAAFRAAGEMLRAHGRKALAAEALLGLGLAWWAAGAIRVGYVEVYLGRVVAAGLLAPSDLAVLERMPALVPRGAVGATRHDDAGLWVPALAGRRATACHVGPPRQEERRAWAGREPPAFSFSGARPDPGLSAEWTTGPGRHAGGGRVLLRRGAATLRALGR